MKKLKKLAAVLLAAAMALTISAPAWATESEETTETPEAGTITINNAAEGKDYAVYKIFDLTYYADKNAYTYSITSDSKWFGFVSNEGDGSSFVTLTEDSTVGEGEDAVTTYFVTWDKNKDPNDNSAAAKEFADLAAAYAKKTSNRINADDEKEADASGTVEFTGLALGYYLVTSTQGTLVMLDTNAPDVVIFDKNTNSVLTKTVDGVVFDIGEDIPFTLKLDITDADAEEKTYTIHDQMGVSLKLVLDAEHSITVKKNGEDMAPAADTYTLYIKEENSEDMDHNSCAFEIHFKEGALSQDDVITVSYTGRFDKTISNPISATADPKRNENKAWLNDQPPVRVTVYTANILINKIIKDTTTPLAGAEFVLKNENGKYCKINEDESISWEENIEDATRVVTGEDGSASFKGLGAGTYYLEETVAPDGYNKLNNDVTIVIPNTRNPQSPYTVSGAVISYTEKVENSKGVELPSTGGMGTTLMIALGSVLLIATGILLVTKRRMHILANED